MNDEPRDQTPTWGPHDDPDRDLARALEENELWNSIRNIIR